MGTGQDLSPGTVVKVKQICTEHFSIRPAIWEQADYQLPCLGLIRPKLRVPWDPDAFLLGRMCSERDDLCFSVQCLLVAFMVGSGSLATPRVLLQGAGKEDGGN